MFKDVSEAGQDRLVSATGRLVDALPIARARSPRKAANEASCEDAACQVSLRRVTRNALREIASDRGDRRSRDVRIGAGSKDLSDDHWQPPSRVAMFHLMTIEFVLNMSLLKKYFEFAQGQRLDQAMSTNCHKLIYAPQHELDFCSDAATIVLGICLAQLGAT
jgi:hypothetical protein